MVDTHIHIIPGVDDGAIDMMMAREMLDMLVEQGVTDLIATSHSDSFLANHQKVMDQYGKLNVLIEETKLPIKLYLGSEVYCETVWMDEIIEGLNEGFIPSLNGTKYVLTEFYDIEEKDARYCLMGLLEAGWIPVIAHAERYRKLKPSFLKKMKKLGCLIQMNAYSVGGEANPITKVIAYNLLQSELVDFLGSDAHRTTHRPPMVKKGLGFLEKYLSEAYVKKISYENAERLLLNRKEDVNE